MAVIPRSAAPPEGGLDLSPAAVAAMRARLPAVADEAVAAIIDEVPGYEAR